MERQEEKSKDNITEIMFYSFMVLMIVGMFMGSLTHGDVIIGLILSAIYRKLPLEKNR